MSRQKLISHFKVTLFLHLVWATIILEGPFSSANVAFFIGIYLLSFWGQKVIWGNRFFGFRLEARPSQSELGFIYLGTPVPYHPEEARERNLIMEVLSGKPRLMFLGLVVFEIAISGLAVRYVERMSWSWSIVLLLAVSIALAAVIYVEHFLIPLFLSLAMAAFAERIVGLDAIGLLGFVFGLSVNLLLYHFIQADRGRIGDLSSFRPILKSAVVMTLAVAAILSLFSKMLPQKAPEFWKARPINWESKVAEQIVQVMVKVGGDQQFQQKRDGGSAAQGVSENEGQGQSHGKANLPTGSEGFAGLPKGTPPAIPSLGLAQIPSLGMPAGGGAGGGGTGGNRAGGEHPGGDHPGGDHPGGGGSNGGSPTDTAKSEGPSGGSGTERDGGAGKSDAISDSEGPKSAQSAGDRSEVAAEVDSSNKGGSERNSPERNSSEKENSEEVRAESQQKEANSSDVESAETQNRQTEPQEKSLSDTGPKDTGDPVEDLKQWKAERAKKIEETLDQTTRYLQWALLALFLGGAFWLLKTVLSTKREKQVREEPLPPRERKKILNRYAEIRKAKLPPEEEVIATFHLFLMIMEARHRERPQGLPTSEYTSKLAIEFPVLRPQFGVLNETFCNVLFGKVDVREQISAYRKAFGQIEKIMV